MVAQRLGHVRHGRLPLTAWVREHRQRLWSFGVRGLQNQVDPFHFVSVDLHGDFRPASVNDVDVAGFDAEFDGGVGGMIAKRVEKAAAFRGNHPRGD